MRIFGSEPQKNSVCQFLKDIEDEFKYMRFFHSQERIILEEQYIPIRVTLERKYPHAAWEASRGYAESQEELKSAYAIKGLADAESQKRQVPWEEAKKGNQRIMVLADPGMGKSTLLKMEASSTAQKERQKLVDATRRVAPTDDVIFPVFLRLSDLDAIEEEIFNAILMLVRRNYPKTSEGIIRLLEEKLIQGKCLLLLDALDEVPKDHRNNLSEKLNRFARNYPCPIICTSRIVGYTGAFLDGAKEVEIVPFSREQIKQHVQNRFTNAAGSINDDSVSTDGFLRELRDKPQIQGSARIPLLLSLLCSLYVDATRRVAPTLPARRCQIYEKAVEYMLSKWSQNRQPQSKGRIRAKIRLLEEFAYHFTCEGVEIFQPDDLYDRIQEYLQGEKVPVDLRSSTASELIAELSEKDGIIQLEKNGEGYMFLHWNFQEYLTASYLSRAKNGIDLAREHFWEYDWHETLSLLAGLMKDPVPLLQALTDEKDDIFSSLLLLAGRCIAECAAWRSHPLIAEIMDRIYKLWKDYPSVDFISSVVWALGRANSQMSERLRKALNDEYSEIREAAAEALAEIGNQQVVEPLIQALKDEDSDVRWRAAEALAEIGSQRVVELLIRALKDEDSDVRRYTVWTLGRIGSQQAVEPLIQALNDEDSPVRYYAAWALGEIGSQQAIEPLIQALKGQDTDIRGAAARALGKIGSQQAIEPLVQALKDEDSDVRWAAAEVLGEIGSQQAIEPLIQALNDEDSNVREAAIEALSKIGSQQIVGANLVFAQAVELLIQALNDEDSDVREAAAGTLGEIGSQQAIESLIQALRGEDSEVRGMAAEALGEIGSQKAVEPLLQALNDEYSDVRWAAARALGKISSQQAIEPLIRAFKDENSDVREAAARALGKIGSQKAVNALIQALDDEDSHVRRGAAVALGETGSKQAVEPLIQALNHSDSEVGHYAVRALDKIGSRQAVEPVNYVLKHKRGYVREAAAKAWGEIGSKQAVDALIQALNDEDSDVRYYVARALSEIIGADLVFAQVEPLIQALKDDNINFRRDAAEALRRIGTLDTLEKVLQSPIIDVYDPDIFPLARTLAVRFSKAETSFIPVYPELITRRS